MRTFPRTGVTGVPIFSSEGSGLELWSRSATCGRLHKMPALGRHLIVVTWYLCTYLGTTLSSRILYAVLLMWSVSHSVCLTIAKSVYFEVLVYIYYWMYLQPIVCIAAWSVYDVVVQRFPCTCVWCVNCVYCLRSWKRFSVFRSRTSWVVSTVPWKADTLGGRTFVEGTDGVSRRRVAGTLLCQCCAVN